MTDDDPYGVAPRGARRMVNDFGDTAGIAHMRQDSRTGPVVVEGPVLVPTLSEATGPQRYRR
jgi:hypothetical protein